MTVRRYTRKSRKDGRAYHEWIVDFYWQHDDGTRQRFRKKSPVNTKTGAEAYELRMRQTLMGGGQVDEPKAVLTLAEFKTRFLRDYAKPENKPSEYRSKEQILDKYLVPALGALPLNEIGAEQIAAYKAKKREARLSPKTINNHLIVLGKMLRVAVEWKVIKEAPAAKPLKVPPQAFDFLTEEQAARLVEASVGVEPWHTMIVLALRTGMRLGELRALHWQDVDFRRGKITVRRAAWLRIIGTPKNNRTREVPLTDATLATLKQLPRHLGSELVFCRSTGAMYSTNHCYKSLGKLLQQAGILADLKHNRGWHVLRHTFASHLVMRGAPMSAVQELMGHASITQTMRYSHLTPEVRAQSVSLLDSLGAHEAREKQDRAS